MPFDGNTYLNLLPFFSLEVIIVEQWQTGSMASPDFHHGSGPLSNLHASFPSELTVEGVSIGGGADDHPNCTAGGMPFNAMYFGEDLSVLPDLPDTNPDAAGTLAGPTTSASGSNPDVEFQAILLEFISQWMKYFNNIPTNPPDTFPATRPGPQFPTPQGPPTHSHVLPIIHSGNQSYPCSWHSEGSEIQCNFVAPDRSGLLHHLGATHRISGATNAPVICRIIDPTTGSVCGTSIKRGNFPRHVDTHYPIRYHCPCCSGTSYSRQDSWKKHVKSRHG